MGKLTAISVKTMLTIPGTYQDGDGLLLKVTGKGAASWVLRLQHDGKRKDIGLGSAKLITLAMARDKAREFRMAIKVERRDILAERKDATSAKVTFRKPLSNIMPRMKVAGKARLMRANGLRRLKITPSPNSETKRRGQ